MKLVDANVLLYADNESAPHHQVALWWLEHALSRGEPVMIPWLSILAYLRISTKPGIFAQPHSIETAAEFLRSVLVAPNVVMGEPDARHLDRVVALLAPLGTGGNLVNDAHLAALALQYDATLVSFDNDFGRFAAVRWELPTTAR